MTNMVALFIGVSLMATQDISINSVTYNIRHEYKPYPAMCPAVFYNDNLDHSHYRSSAKVFAQGDLIGSMQTYYIPAGCFETENDLRRLINE